LDKEDLINLRRIATRIGEFLLKSQDAKKNPSIDILTIILTK